MAAHVTKPIAPEDIRVGDFLVELYFVWQYADSMIGGMDADKPMRIHNQLLLPRMDSLDLLWVDAVCLPFVAVLKLDGEIELLDTRRFRFGLVPEAFAQVVIEGSDKSRKGSITRRARERILV
ncbi:MAG: hypothetical protein AAGI17_01055 [Planctomycetota bacterium]